MRDHRRAHPGQGRRDEAQRRRTVESNKRLLANEKESKLVRHIFKRYCQLGSTTELASELNAQGHRTKAWTTAKGTVTGGRPRNKAHLYRLLNNRKYISEIEHKWTFGCTWRGCSRRTVGAAQPPASAFAGAWRT